MQKFLTDTHVLIWLAEEPGKISNLVEPLLNSDNELLLSYVSIWEMAIKIKTGKLKLAMNLEDFVTKAVEKHSLHFLPVSLEHIYQTDKLELLHKDPFDRLLIAQSIVERISVISSDTAFDAYGIHRIWQLISSLL